MDTVLRELLNVTPSQPNFKRQKTSASTNDPYQGTLIPPTPAPITPAPMPFAPPFPPSHPALATLHMRPPPLPQTSVPQPEAQIMQHMRPSLQGGIGLPPALPPPLHGVPDDDMDMASIPDQTFNRPSGSPFSEFPPPHSSTNIPFGREGAQGDGGQVMEDQWGYLNFGDNT